MKSFQKGFTLIELMIVIAIIGILAAIAIPAYQNYTIRSQVTEGLSLADGFKTAISEFYDQNGVMPVSASVAGSATQIAAAAVTGKYVQTITVANGQIQVLYGAAQANAKIVGKRLDLSPGVDVNGDIVWVCGTAAVPNVPALQTAPPADTTTVPNQFLPSACHP
ncbi:MAG TPA: pilin [Steroidobacteraceae bacterium]|jgi:type IV pilus assembly protein PilA|nr:pilin [Steroidobacteraceae bacterium]